LTLEDNDNIIVVSGQHQISALKKYMS